MIFSRYSGTITAILGAHSKNVSGWRRMYHSTKVIEESG